MVEDHEFQEMQVRVSELERLVKHQGEQLAVHARNTEQHGDHVARLARAQVEVEVEKRVQTALGDQSRQMSQSAVPQLMAQLPQNTASQGATQVSRNEVSTEAAQQARAQTGGAFS